MSELVFKENKIQAFMQLSRLTANLYIHCDLDNFST